MGKLEKILDESYHIRAVHKVAQHIYNEGLNAEALEHEKEMFMKEVFAKMKDELLTVTKHYPVDDVQEIDLVMDLIIIPRAQLDKILGNAHV